VDRAGELPVGSLDDAACADDCRRAIGRDPRALLRLYVGCRRQAKDILHRRDRDAAVARFSFVDAACAQHDIRDALAWIRDPKARAWAYLVGASIEAALKPLEETAVCDQISLRHTRRELRRWDAGIVVRRRELPESLDRGEVLNAHGSGRVVLRALVLDDDLIG